MTVSFDLTFTLWGSREMILALYHCWSRWKKAMQAWFSCHLVSSNLWGSLSLNRCCISSLSSLNSSSAHHVDISWTLKIAQYFFANTYMLSFLISQREGIHENKKIEQTQQQGIFWWNKHTQLIFFWGLRVENISVVELKK